MITQDVYTCLKNVINNKEIDMSGMSNKEIKSLKQLAIMAQQFYAGKANSIFDSGVNPSYYDIKSNSEISVRFKELRSDTKRELEGRKTYYRVLEAHDENEETNKMLYGEDNDEPTVYFEDTSYSVSVVNKDILNAFWCSSKQ